MSLRRIAVLALSVLLLPRAAGALDLEKGVKAGVNLAGFRGEFADLADPKTRTGFVGGAFVALGFAPDLAVQVEALYSQKGAKFEGELVDAGGNPRGTFDSFVQVDYLEIPVLLRGTLLRGAPVQPVYFLGPTAGISLGGKLVAESAVVPDQDLDDLKAVDVGLALGVGAACRLGAGKALVEFRWTTGFGDIYDVEGNAESVNNVFALMAGVSF